MNHSIFFSLYSLAHRSDAGDWLFVFLSEVFGFIFFFFVAILFAFYKEGSFSFKTPFKDFKSKFKEMFITFFPAVFSWLFATIIKKIIVTPRPFVLFDQVNPLFVHGSLDSFPSGHAMFFATLATSLFFVNKKLGLLFSFIALVVGLSRVISGVHFPVDILTGYISGIIIGLFFNYLFKKIKKNNPV